MSLDPERTPVVYPVFAWLEIAERLTTLGDGALGESIRQAKNGRPLGDDAPFDLTEDERARVQAVIAEDVGEERWTVKASMPAWPTGSSITCRRA